MTGSHRTDRIACLGGGGGLPDAADTAWGSGTCVAESGSLATGGAVAGDQFGANAAAAPACTTLKKAVVVKVKTHMKKGKHRVHIPLTKKARKALTQAKRKHITPCTTPKLTFPSKKK